MRTVLITGATSGFGKLMTQAFLEHGDLVIATGRKLEQRPDVFEVERKKFPEHLIELSLDVTDVNQIDFVSNFIASKFKGLDILINNAGFGHFGALEEFSLDQVKNQMEVNFFGTFSMTKHCLPLLRKSRGKIFNFSSVFGFMGFPLTSLYCASKFAVEGLTESLKLELTSHGVQVCLIQPGGYRTDFGKNLSWNLKGENSPYLSHLKNYQSLHDYFSQKKKQEPIEVAQGVLKLSFKRRLPMRKVFGQDAKLSYLFKTFTPEFLYFLIFEYILSRILSNKIKKI